MEKITHVPLEPSALRLNIDPNGLGFETLFGLEENEETETLAQERAVKALAFGLEIRHPDFNVYVAGPKETGLFDLARMYVEQVAKTLPSSPSDWCYVYNFKDHDSPIAIRLEQGRGREFKRDMSVLVDNLKLHIPKIFESEIYISRKEEIIRAFNKARSQVFEELDRKVRESGFILQADQTGMMVIPAKGEGVPFTPDELSTLSEEQQMELKTRSEMLHREMGSTMRHVHQLEQEVSERLRALDAEMVGQVCDRFIDELKKKYEGHGLIQDYLSDVKADVIKNMDDFRSKPQAQTPFPFPMMTPSFTQYEVNLIVDNIETKGAPVVIESNPSYPNLFGSIEKKAQFGALVTDFTMIKAGAFHKANGGYLIIKAMDLLKWPFSYEALKRSLRDRRLEIEDPGEQFGLFTTKTLKPMAIPLDIKIVLVGNSEIYQLLYNFDEDFRELFKVKAHMDVHVDRNEARLGQLLQSVKTIVKKNGLRDIHNTGIAKLIEYSAELAGSQEKLSLKVSDIADLICEADFWAAKDGSPLITGEYIQKAMNEKAYRCRLYEDHLQELLAKGIIKVNTSGRAVGQVNGLAIYDLGDYIFGKPSRITANISLGKEGVINIEREAELSGSIHTKGVMILSGYLRAYFSADRPLTLAATICFEQSYGMIDGDSASGAELFALLSALSGMPIDQGIAVTGAVSQKGEILPIGGVTQKIEGFFDLCKAHGLTGSQGVIIPKANVKDLMLKEEVVGAVEAGRFHIWAIETVEEGIEILTGIPAGVRDVDGNYPEGTLFYLVDLRLQELAEAAKSYGHEEEGVMEEAAEGAGS
ncbi:Lon protease family protein [Dissulfurimicrobium hydrothermale]|uniref:Lon protease family protein n=2 Tax=Dissulfurimicrobium TaxID=1769732 RepID=UPI001ED9E069|nr:ATP-binding protein [Dissulfurimicrobium hydrothermale]UKL12988.1 AAA family ATPase [Dissulfurimicrobium hydrothermale]